ncbi:MAG: ParA family protein [Candidatus Binatia bacterium]
MTRLEIRDRIQRNIQAAGLTLQELRVQPDPFSGWRVVVISPDFARMPQEKRRGTAFKGLENLTFQWVDLLTPEEREWAGDLPIDSEMEDLPMWPEALARVESTEPVVFLSDLDEDLERPIVATFYSIRGGVGRSTALAYTAYILASRGHSVLCVDMDLEAPGLAALCGREDEVQEGQGVVSLLLALDQGENPDMVKHVIRLSESDELYCLPAGIPNADYARRLRLLDPEAWYREEHNPLHVLLKGIAELPFKPDVVLMDARTGITPMSAPLLFDLSDLAIVIFFPHPQAHVGTRALVHAIIRARSRREFRGQRLTPEPRFLVSPIPASKAPGMQRYKLRALEWIDAWLVPLENRRTEEAPPIEVEDITQFVPYRELIATSDYILADREAWQNYELIAEWLERFIPVKSEEQIPRRLPEVKQTILDGLEFSTGTAELQEHFLDSFVRTALFEKAMALDKPLVLGRKGTGKTAIFRRILEGEDQHAAAILSPAPFRNRYPWVLSPDGFQAIESSFDETQTGWREFWTIYTGLACFLSSHTQGESSPFPTGALRAPVEQLAREQHLTESKVVSCLTQVLREPQIGLLAWDWLQSLDMRLEDELLVMFDGLDTGFGNRHEERERRTRASEGLFAFVMDRESALEHMHFKILLREDIWRKLRFENKSHLYGRSVRIEWRSQGDYAKTVLKQALRNDAFTRLVEEAVPSLAKEDIDSWSDDKVFQVWNVLVGERMKGGKTAFTRNWVWNRLADGNGDHGPRALLQLFREATAWEQEEHQRNPYDRTVIRPRALIASLDRVSEEALQALLEEFAELEEFVAQLRSIGRSPMEASEIESLAEQLRLAREVGLVQVYEGTEEEVLRYRIPDLYRIALGMTRKGQA